VSNQLFSKFGRRLIVRLLLHWILSALAVWIVAHIVPGIYVTGPIAALIAAAVIGLVNATLGLLLKIITFPLTILTLGLFWFVINALMLELAAALVNGFYVRNFIAALIGAVMLSLVSSVLQWLVMPSRKQN
jgi:putative membrane protein